MKDSKIVQLLNCFSNKQLKKFKDFVASPYFNKKEEVLLLYNTLYKFAPNFESAKMSKEQVYSAVDPNTPYNEKSLGYWMSDLVKLAEQFLAIEQLGEDSIQNSDYLLSVFNSWNLAKPFQRELRNANKQQGKNNYRDADYYYKEYLLRRHENAFFLKKTTHSHDDSLQAAIDNLDIYYMALKLKFSCEILNRQNVIKGEYFLKMVDSIVAFIEQDKEEVPPPVAIYHQIYKTLSNTEDEAHFHRLKELISEHIRFFPPSEARDIYRYATNYAIRKINRGLSKFNIEIFRLYQEIIDKELLLLEGQVSPWTYQNIVSIGLRVQEFNWTSEFIEEYREKITDDFKTVTYSYCKANLLFTTKKYEEAMVYLQAVDASDVYYSINYRVMLLQIYYELDEVDAFMSLVDSFKVYLRRNKLISAFHKEISLNFIKFASRLHKIIERDHKQLDKLKADIEAIKQTAAQQWLLSKIKEKKR